MNARHRPRAPSAADAIAAILAQLNRVILGKDAQIRLCLACLLARGHLLIEDIPGVGKTTLAHALAKTLGLSFQRVQFTSDLLPADVLGVSIYDRETGQVPLSARADLRAAGARRRDQPRLAQGAERAARGDGGAPGDARRPVDAAARAVLRHRHAKSAGAGRHLSAARIAARPVPDARASGLSGRRRRARAAERRSIGASWSIRSPTVVERRRACAACSSACSGCTSSPALLDYVQALVAHTRSAAGLERRARRRAPRSACCARRAPGH